MTSLAQSGTTTLVRRRIRVRGVVQGAQDFRRLAVSTAMDACGKLVFGIFAALAEFERELIIERTKAGMAAARALGGSW